jgi:hypothetical protein
MEMNKKIILCVLFCLFGSTQASAITMKNQSPGCFSQSSLSEFSNALKSGDKTGGMRLIMNQECFFIESGTPYGVINKQSSMSLIRVYWDANGYKLWVPTRAIQ